MTKIPNEVVRYHSELCADLLRLGTTDGERATAIREMINRLEKFYPELERRRVAMMQDAILQED